MDELMLIVSAMIVRITGAPGFFVVGIWRHVGAGLAASGGYNRFFIRDNS